MFKINKYKTFMLLANLSLLISSCGTSPQIQSEIATSVAQTVEAQNSLTEIEVSPTFTPVPAFEVTTEFTLTPETSMTTTPPSASNPGCVTSATLAGENPPDNTLFKPGDYFWKTWTFLNTGTCTWDNSYSLVFWDGDLMGGLTSYPLPEIVTPGDTINISIYLQAPAIEGTAMGYWRFQTPWDTNFGVGPQSGAFYVQIGVSAKPRYGITNVEYALVRNPATGCPTNVRFTVYAKVTASGPMDFSYFWDQSDGNESGIKRHEFKEAGSVTFEREWTIHKGDSPNPRWIQFVLTGSHAQDFGKVVITHDCYSPE